MPLVDIDCVELLFIVVVIVVVVVVTVAVVDDHSCCWWCWYGVGMVVGICDVCLLVC